MTHKIETTNLSDFDVRHEVAFAVGKGEDKHLIVVVKDDKVSYEIIDHDVKVTAYTLRNAIELYNKL